MRTTPTLGFAPIRWLRETAPVKLKLGIAFGLICLLTAGSLTLGWWAFGRVPPLSGAAAAELQHVRTVLVAGRITVIVGTLLVGYVFGGLIAVPYVTIVRRMEKLAAGDLSSPIPFTKHSDCVGRIAKAMFTFRDTAISQQKAAELNRSQALALHSANAKLERLTRHLSAALEQAKQASQAKSRFLAGMSHELRTPLTGLLGYARLLRLDGDLSPTQEERVSAMLEAGAHLLETINRVLDLSEIESERAEVKPVVTDVMPTAMACLGMVQPGAVAKGLALTLEQQTDAPVRLYTDATRLRQVMLNLLSNAVKFTTTGSVQMRLAPARAWPGGLRVEVADTGPGIPRDQRGQLFQEFGRLDTAANSQVEGAGLGLALSMRLAHLLGGTIDYAENPGGGSLFWMEVPTMRPASGAAEPAPAEIEMGPPRKLHILVVDDLAMNREIARAFLCAAGHDVLCAEGGAEAVGLAAKGRFDVIVMDIRMPEMDGLEATRRIRALPAPHGQVPIVAMTAQAFAEQVEECRAAGMNLHVSKPFAPEDLTRAVARAAGEPGSGGAGDAVAAAAAAPDDAVDSGMFARTAAMLPPDVLKYSLQTIAERARGLLGRIEKDGRRAEQAPELANLAHALGGSAGMFGFKRLASAAKHYEYAVQAESPDSTVLLAELSASATQAVAVLDDKLKPVAAAPIRPDPASLPGRAPAHGELSTQA
jgi:signal transduction histidine kinase/CheY-like chemotaxis protein/HPt (histidine-containing phosphotransfer) domain-containing protein